jgi:hypothetical protein
MRLLAVADHARFCTNDSIFVFVVLIVVLVASLVLTVIVFIVMVVVTFMVIVATRGTGEKGNRPYFHGNDYGDGMSGINSTRQCGYGRRGQGRSYSWR